MKRNTQVILAVSVLMASGTHSAHASGEFLKLVQVPDNCKEGKASSETKFWFGAEKLAIGMEEGAAIAQMDLAKSELGLYQQNRDRSYLEKSKSHLNDAQDQLQKSAAQRFEMADTALSAGCLDVADDGYREILKTYTRPSDQAIRDRAKIGIDDVRAKQPR